MDEERLELYGFDTEDLEGVRELLEERLGVAFEAHESDLIGPYYFAPLCADHAEMTLRPNLDAAFDPEVDDPEESLAEPDFAGFGVLLYVEWRNTSHSCRELLQRIAPAGQLLAVE